MHIINQSINLYSAEALCF